ncbi:MAG: MgtC/SapB family protein [Acidobacteriota bacterium]|nr:MgtC/SapB family protein [Acidobacteriota bacterium]
MIAVTTAVLRLAVALAFGSVIGVEREWRQKHAGLKTMALVALGAAAFAMMSNTFGPLNHNPGQIAAAVVGGIGFIGAGVIMHRGAAIQGVTTAATLWAAASVGVAAGLGQFPLATVLTTGIVIVQFMVRGFEIRILRARRQTAPGRLEIRVECDFESLELVNDSIGALSDLEPIRTSVQRTADHLIVRHVLRTKATVDLTMPEERLVSLKGVRRVDVRHLGLEDAD